MSQLASATDHATTRMRQRGIDQAAVDLLLQFGREAHDHHGGVVVYMDHRAREAASRALGVHRGAAVDRLRSLYAVIGSDGQVITVGHRYRRVQR